MNALWGQFLFILLAFSIVYTASEKILRKWLHVDKKKLFSYNHVNRTHGKIDWTIRISFMLLLIISLFYHIDRIPEEPIWYFQTPIIIFAYIVVSETVTAIMEKRHAPNKNDYLFTLIQLGMIVIFSLIVYFIYLNPLI